VREFSKWIVVGKGLPERESRKKWRLSFKNVGDDVIAQKPI
jgi:stalled ribosome alternative rescue factor ArfA